MTVAMDRFWAKVDKCGPPSDFNPALGVCWLWTGSRSGLGYGRFVDRNMPGPQQHPAHRWLYQQIHGLLARGIDVDHLCRVRACVRPEHLEAVPHRENALRGANGRLKTHCRRGHPYEGGDVSSPRDGIRVCRACQRINWKKRAPFINPRRRKSAVGI